MPATSVELTTDHAVWLCFVLFLLVQDESLKNKQGDIPLSDQTLVTGKPPIALFRVLMPGQLFTQMRLQPVRTVIQFESQSMLTASFLRRSNQSAAHVFDHADAWRPQGW
jgi:hypothetical protein